MNRKTAEEWVGKYVKWDWWHFTDNKTTMSAGRVIYAKEVKDSIWILNKVTKGGLCMISQHGMKESISVPPMVLSQWEYKE